MQFSRKFLISSILVLLIGVTTWQLGLKDNLAAEEELAKATPETESASDDKLSKSMASLNNVGGKETPISVSAEPAIRGTLIQQVSAQGRIFTYSKTDLVSEVSGHLRRLYFRDGDRVKKGQLIAEIDDREYKMEVQDAESAYLTAKANYVVYDSSKSTDTPGPDASLTEKFAKLKEDLKSGTINKDEYDRRHFELELEELRSGSRQDDVAKARLLTSAQTRLDKARFMLQKTKIYAPFDGMLFDVSVAEGVFLNGNAKLAQLTSTSDLVVKVKVLESEMGDVFSGRPASVRLTALPSLGAVEGVVQSVSPYVNETDKTVETVVRIKSSDERIRPGMFAEVQIDSKIFEDRLMVPKTAILPRDNRKVVFKVGDDSRAKWIYVETGVENNHYVEITEGELAPGERVLTDNHFTMGHDTLVKVSQSDDE